MKRQLWDDEKKYKTEINRLEYQLAEKKGELEEVRAELEKLRKNGEGSSGPSEAVQMQIMRHKLEEMVLENVQKAN